MSQRKRKSYALDLQEEADTIKELDVVQTKKHKANPANDHQNLSNIYQNVQNNISYAYLPPEVLLSIFYSLQIKDLIRAGSTCHSWQLVSKEESLQWFHAREFTFSEDDMAYSILSGHYDNTISDILERRKKQFANAGLPVKIMKYEDFQFDRDGICHAFLADAAGNPAAIARYDRWLSIEEGGFKIFEKGEYFRFKLDTQAAKSLNFGRTLKHTIICEANLLRIASQIRRGNEQMEFRLFKQLMVDRLESTVFNCTKHDKPQEIDHYFNPQKSNVPQVPSVITEQPNRMTGVKLDQNQLLAINWMVHVEKNIDKKYTVSPLLQTGVPNVLLQYGSEPSQQRLVLFENRKQFDLSFTAKGGVFADVLGLRSTTEVLGLILSNPMMDQAPKCEPFFATKATLVLCPAFLTEIWMKDSLGYKLRVIEIKTLQQAQKLTYAQIMNADVVVVPHNFFESDDYKSYPYLSRVTDRAVRMNKLLEDRKNNAPETIRGVILDHFHWHRVILSKGHELIEDAVTMGLINNLRRTYAWYISGTPFPNLPALAEVRNFLGISNENAASLASDLVVKIGWYFNRRSIVEANFEVALNEVFIRNLVWRNLAGPGAPKTVEYEF